MLLLSLSFSRTVTPLGIRAEGRVTRVARTSVGTDQISFDRCSLLRTRTQWTETGARLVVKKVATSTALCAISATRHPVQTKPALAGSEAAHPSRRASRKQALPNVLTLTGEPTSQARGTAPVKYGLKPRFMTYVDRPLTGNQTAAFYVEELGVATLTALTNRLRQPPALRQAIPVPSRV